MKCIECDLSFKDDDLIERTKHGYIHYDCLSDYCLRHRIIGFTIFFDELKGGEQ